MPTENKELEDAIDEIPDLDDFTEELEEIKPKPKTKPEAKPKKAVDMTKYKCHKIVEALKIKQILKSEKPIKNGSLLSDDNLGVPVSPEYTGKHNPEVGGYYVKYEDGYESYSPAKAFEEGYTKLDDIPKKTEYLEMESIEYVCDGPLRSNYDKIIDEVREIAAFIKLPDDFQEWPITLHVKHPYREQLGNTQDLAIRIKQILHIKLYKITFEQMKPKPKEK